LKRTVILSFLVLGMVIGAGSVNAGKAQGGSEKARACTVCHGKNGISPSTAFPNLAGQKEAYLVKQLKDFREKRRVNPTMNAMAGTLSDRDISELAAYFSSLGCGQKSVASPGAAPRLSAAARGHATAEEFPGAVFVTMKEGGSVQAFPSGRVWKGGPAMLYDAITPDGKRLLVTSPKKNALYVFETDSGKELAVIHVGRAPKGVKVSPDGKVAYVANQGSASISVIDLRKLVLRTTIAVKDGPHNMVFGPGGRLAYVTLQGGAGIGVIDTETEKLMRVIPVPGIKGPHNIDISSDDQMAYVRDIVNHVAVVELKTGRVMKIIEVGSGHGGIDLSPDGRFVVTGAIGDDYISIIGTKTFGVRKIKVGSGPHGVRASRDNRWIYVAVTKDDVVAVIETKTMKVVKKIPVGRFPFWLALRGNP
jgi:YVTN family beta-propeller protein